MLRWGGKKLKFTDVKVPTNISSYEITTADLGIKKIEAAGAMSRPHDGWMAFNVTYDETKVTISFVNGIPAVNWIIRIWYYV